MAKLRRASQEWDAHRPQPPTYLADEVAGLQCGLGGELLGGGVRKGKDAGLRRAWASPRG